MYLCCPYKQLVHMLTCMQYKCSYVTLSSSQVIYSLVNLYALRVFLCYFVVFTSNLFTC